MIQVIDRRDKAMGGQTNDRALSVIEYIGVHWSGVSNGTIEGHESYWKNTNKWVNGGYHFWISRAGVVHWNYNLTKRTNGVGDHNTKSAHVCYEGGPNAPITDAQRETLKYVINVLMKPNLPNLKNVWGHNEFPDTKNYQHSKNQCPGLNMNDLRAFLDAKTETPKPAPKPQPTPTPTPKKSVAEIAKDIYYGRNGWAGVNNPERANRLKALGYDATAVQNEINKLAKPAAKPKANLKITGVLDKATIEALQRYLGTTVDGVISKPSMVVKALQRKIGAVVDGYWGTETTRKLQKYLGTIQDGFLSSPSMVIKEMQRRLNAGTF